MNPDTGKLDTTIEPRWTERLNKHAHLKKAIATSALKENLISSFDHIFIDCGSTFAYLAEEIFTYIEKFFPLTIYTTNIEVFQRYLQNENRDLINFKLIGGTFIPHHQSFDGDNFSISKVKNAPIIDRAFVGACPLDSKLRLMGTITDVIKIKKQIIENSAEVVILCDESKFMEPEHGSRTVGHLMIENQKLYLALEDESQSKIPARIVVGVDNNAKHSEGYENFIAIASNNGLFENKKVILSKVN